MPSRVPPVPVLVELTRTVSSPAPRWTSVRPLTDRTTTVSLPAPVSIVVGREVPAWVLSTVYVSLPEPRATARLSKAV